jgi:A/G-specific adenine glycosylase
MPENVGDFNQAMMDLGSEICKPKNPLCGECPIMKTVWLFPAKDFIFP